MFLSDFHAICWNVSTRAQHWAPCKSCVKDGVFLMHWARCHVFGSIHACVMGSSLRRLRVCYIRWAKLKKIAFQPWHDYYAVSRLVGYVCEAADSIWLWRKQLACSGARSSCSWFVENSAAFLLFAYSREGRSLFLVMAMKDQDHSTQITLLHSLLQAVLTGIADESTAVCKQPKITN